MKKAMSAVILATLALTGCVSREGVPNTGKPTRLKAAALQIPRQHPGKVVVKPGDTVYGLAYKHGLTSRSIIVANKLKPPYQLEPGQKLVMPSPQEHIVVAGEDVLGIAAFYGVDVKVLARENNLDSQNPLKIGDRLSIPQRDTVSAVAPPKNEGPTIATVSLQPLDLPKEPKAVTEAESSSDIAAEIAKERLGVLDIQSELAAEREGLLRKVATEKVAPQVESAVAAEEAKESSEPVVPLPPTKPAVAIAATTVAVATTAVKSAPLPVVKPKVASAAQAVAFKPVPKPTGEGIPTPMAKPKTFAKVKPTAVPSKPAPAKTNIAVAPSYAWPVKGKVISKFGATVGGSKNDGINIAVARGTPVKAAAGGEVVYSGDALKGFGNLILVKHPNGYMTAYGNNDKLLVKKGQKVAQGQKIAVSGSSGDVKFPQLHFELRKGTQPIDPLPKLGS